jgi:hypothetical protein
MFVTFLSRPVTDGGIPEAKSACGEVSALAAPRRSAPARSKIFPGAEHGWTLAS